MKTRFISALIISSVLLTSLFAENNYLEIQQEIDSLRIELNELKSNHMDVNPYHTGETLNWGTGFFGGTEMGTEYSMDLELGYMFKIRQNPFGFLSRDYIENRSSYRIGLSTGIQMFENEIVYHDDSTFHKSSGCGAFGKINFGSPILFNLVSFSWHVKAMYIEPESDSTHDITDGRMVFGYGNDIEFWLTKNSCATIGFTDERDTFSDDDLSDSLYPSKVRFVFGFKTYFNN